MDKRLLAENIVHNVLINKNTGYNPSYTKNYKHLNNTWKEMYLNIKHCGFTENLNFSFYALFSNFFTVYMSLVGNRIKNKLNF